LSITRAKTSSIAQGPSTNRNLLAGNPTILPGSYESIATVTVGAGGSNSISFSSIASTYTHLQLRVSATTAASGKVMVARFNSDSTTSYTWHFLNGQGTTASAGNATGNTYARFFGQNIGTNTTNPSVSIMDILDYANTNKNKTVRALSGSDNNGSGEVALESSLWIKTNAINAITISLTDSSNFSQNSSFALYGIK
jgi:hypothetical protein